MRTAHGYSRLVGFSDGVVAIAITLLVLPLVEAASDYTGDAGQFIAEHLGKLLLFLLSFAVIGNFWVVHHGMWEQITGYNRALLWSNLLWLLSIVFLPFPTALLASGPGPDRATYGLYVGTMVVTTAADLLMQAIIVRTPQLQAEEVRGTIRLSPYVIPVAIMVVTLLIAVLFPAVGLWGLALFAISGPLERAVARRRKKDAA
ncbi:TMEM175 family protein [soil metagenome]